MHAAPPSQRETDLSHLSTLAICHYVGGGLAMVFSSIFILYVVMGIAFLRDPSFMTPPPQAQPPGWPPVQQQQQQPPPPAFMGWMFICMGAGGVTLGWATGILTILSGRCLKRQRRRMFSFV